MVLNNQATASPLPLARLQLEEVVNSLGHSGGGATGDSRSGAACGSPSLSQRSGFQQSSNFRRESSHVLADISEVDTVSNGGGGGDNAIQTISSMFPTVDE